MNVKLLKVAFSITGAIFSAGLTGYLLYLLYRNDDEEILNDTEIDFIKDLVTERIKIPKESIGVIIGRNGSNVQMIQKETCSNINFSAIGDSERYCTIRGQKENVEKAKILISKYIEDNPNTELKFSVPQSACGKIIGKGGATIIGISKKTRTKVFLERFEENFEAPDSDSSTRIVTIKGSRENIEAARQAVMEKVREDSMSRNIPRKGTTMIPSSRMNKQDEFTSNRKQTALSIAAMTKIKQDNKLTTHTNSNESAIPLAEGDPNNNKDTFYKSHDIRDVYVTAVASPTSFWIQILSSKSAMLKNLINEMTKFYNNARNKCQLHPKQRKIGKMVAARYPGDDLIYRGKISPYQTNDDPNLLVIYYVDYGDVELLHPSVVYDLKEEFTKLEFQAIECSLHGVEEIKECEKESTAVFEELSHSACFVKITAKLMGYKESYGRKIPDLELVSHYGNEELNIAKEMIRRKLLKEKNIISSVAHDQLPDDVLEE